MAVADNIEQQRALYGEPLGDLVRRTGAALGLSQAAVAKVLGLSPAMLSHLVTGQRVKIANPAALTRLQALVELGAAAPGLTTGEVRDRLAAIEGLSADLTTGRVSGIAAEPSGPRVLSSALRAVASGRELEAAVAALRETAPELAELLRVYGTGSEQEQRQHYATIRHLTGP